MGAATRYRKKFLSEHPKCAFCGGNADAKTIEHCPPRAMFQFREWPEGFEFPACENCNLGTDNEDLLVAMLARIDPFEEKGDKDGKQVGLMRAVNKQFPGLFEKMMPTASEARRQNRELGITPKDGRTHQEAGPLKVPEEFHRAVCIFARKLAKGIFYREAGFSFPNDGCLLLNWFTNADFMRDGKYTVFDLLKELSGDAPPLLRGGKFLNDQFEYKLSISPNKNVFVVQARFGNAFGFAVFGSTTPGTLETSIERLREQSQRDGPFAVLQSLTLGEARGKPSGAETSLEEIRQGCRVRQPPV
ncbi:hypothetical protein V4F39_16485 [Aquincola sp. MAHUQ-54]|uniref:HNH endonuclease n=1 Tax=Aquincola agrisoli TaxID=3119538 RepID=A0AAW9QJC2_9BURK